MSEPVETRAFRERDLDAIVGGQVELHE